jgi:protein O-mannosyl-transferase
MTSKLRERLVATLALAAILLLAWWSYFPGLAGSFLFDDYPNLLSLGAYGPVDDATTFWRYLTSGTADATGRPVALLSFLLDARNWPAEPYAFKRNNVLLHLLNGALLALLLLRLGQRHSNAAWQMPPLRPLLGMRGDVAIALLGAALWLLHPLFLSTTLYVVQREAMLPATFALIGLCGYTKARARVMAGDRRGLWWAAAWLTGSTLLATLSKANGALLPLLAWLIDGWLRYSQPACDERTRAAWRRWRFVLVIVPSLAVLTGLGIIAIDGLLNGFPLRPWTLGERLLTQPRILLEYLYLLGIPRPISPGLFNDNIVVSRSLLAPLATLPALLTILFLAGLAWRLRRRIPAASLAVMFFLAAHLMESTVVPLELYFEHRNYLPAMLLFWPIAIWLMRADLHLDAVRTGLAIALPLALALLTRIGAGLWGDADGQGLVWAYQNADSPRAQAYAAQIEMRRGQPDAAATRLERALTLAPREAQLALNLLGARCQTRTLAEADIDSAVETLRRTDDISRTAIEWFDEALGYAGRDGYCPVLSLNAIERMIEACEANPRFLAHRERVQDLLDLHGRIALARGQSETALAYFRRSLDASPSDSAALWQTAALASSGFPVLALQHLNYWQYRARPVAGMKGLSMARVHARLLERQGYWRDELQHMRTTLLEDVAQKNPERSP